MKVADGIVVRVARKAVRGMEEGRARASIVRERAEAMVVDFKNDVVARIRVLGGGVGGECGNENSKRL